MKCFELQGPDGVEGLKLVDRPIPKPGPGQVLVRITAATLNYRDLLTVKGGYGSRQKFPLIPVSDGAGVVEAVGSGVREFAPSDRVVGSFFETWIGGEPSAAKMHGAFGGAVDGVLAEYRVFPSQALVRTPDHLTDAEALAMSAIPLHMQRKFERRWAARFASPVASAVPKTTDSKGTVNSWPRPAKANPLSNRDPSMAETGTWVPARPHDSGSQSSNETVDGLDSTTEALRHAAEDTASGAAPDDIEKTPVFDRAGLAPKI